MFQCVKIPLWRLAYKWSSFVPIFFLNWERYAVLLIQLIRLFWCDWMKIMFVYIRFAGCFISFCYWKTEVPDKSNQQRCIFIFRLATCGLRYLSKFIFHFIGQWMPLFNCNSVVTRNHQPLFSLMRFIIIIIQMKWASETYVLLCD